MTLRASLLLEGDSKGATKALDETERGLQNVGRQMRATNQATSTLASTSTTATREMARGMTNASQAAGLSAHQVQNLSFQVNDLSQQLATGASPFTAIVQQGSQIVQVFGPGVGVAGALRAVGSAMTSFLLNPLTLATIGFAAVSQAAVTFFSNVREGSGSTEDLLGRHEDLVERIGDAYDDAGESAKAFADESGKVLRFRLEQNIEQLRTQLQGDVASLISSLLGGGDEFGERQLNPRFNGLAGAIGNLELSAQNGAPDVARFREELVELARTDPSLTETVNELLAASDAIDKLSRALRAGAEGTADRITKVVQGLNEEIAAVGRSKLENAILDAQRKAGVNATSIEGQAIAALVTKHLQLQAASKTATVAARKANTERQRAAKTASDLVAKLREELELSRLGNAEREVERNLREAGAAATAEQRVEIVALTNAIRVSREARKQEKELLEELRDVGSSVAGGLTDAFVQFAERGKVSVKGMAASILQDLARIGQAAATRGLGNLIGDSLSDLFGGGPTNIIPSAKGNAFLGGRQVTAFNTGGVPGLITQPTAFPMRGGGIGIAGELDDEAIFPLERGTDGKLGIRGSGGSTGGVSVSFAPTINSNIGAVDRAWIMGELQKLKADVLRTIGDQQRRQILSRSDSFVRP